MMINEYALLNELTKLINRYNYDTKCNLPDYVIADLLFLYLNNLVGIRSYEGLNETNR